MCSALRSTRHWLDRHFTTRVGYQDQYMRWAKTEYKNDWQYHYWRLINQAEENRKNKKRA